MVRILNLYQTKIPMAQQSTHVLPAIEHLTGLVAEAGSPFLASAKPLGVKQSWQSTWFLWAVWQVVLWQSLSRIYIYIYLFLQNISIRHYLEDLYANVRKPQALSFSTGSSSSCYGRGLGTLRNRLTPYTGNRMIQWKSYTHSFT